jgi:hypothetical protein
LRKRHQRDKTNEPDAVMLTQSQHYNQEPVSSSMNQNRGRKSGISRANTEKEEDEV